jgi:hypothetical protein
MPAATTPLPSCPTEALGEAEEFQEAESANWTMRSFTPKYRRPWGESQGLSGERYSQLISEKCSQATWEGLNHKTMSPR